MGRIKLIAKSHLLGNTLPLLLVFTVLFSSVVISGNFSFLLSGLLNLPFIKAFVTTAFAESMIKISLSVIGIVISVLIIPPLRLGTERWFFLRASGEETRVKDLFHYFSLSRFLRSQQSFFYSFFIRSGVFIFFQFPALCLSGVLYTAVMQGETAFSVVLCLGASAVILSAAGLGFYFVYSTEWFLYYYIVVSSDTISPEKAYKFSSAFVKNAVGKVCLFRLSFLPWWLLCVFIFPLFYVWGYYKQSLAVLAFRNEYLRKQK